MNKEIVRLNPKEIALLKENFESLKFQNDFDIVYEAQVPTAGLILLEGEINLLKKKKVCGSVLPMTLVGMQQLMTNIPMKVGMRILSNSELLVLHKSEIMKALEDKKSKIYGIIKKAVG